MLRPAPLLVLILLIAQSATARADESRESSDAVSNDQPAPPTRWAGRPLAIMGYTGFAPGGGLGGAFELTPIDAISVEGGIGMAWGTGARGMLMPRARVFLGRSVAVSLGAGISFGGKTDPIILFCYWDCSHKEWSQAFSVDALAGIEGRTNGGFAWRAFAGTGWLANPNDYRCVGGGTCPSTPRFTPYLGLSMGYAARMSP